MGNIVTSQDVDVFLRSMNAAEMVVNLNLDTNFFALLPTSNQGGVWKHATGVLAYGEYTPVVLDNAAIISALGYTPINKAGDTGVGNISMGNLTAGTGTFSGTLTVPQANYIGFASGAQIWNYSAGNVIALKRSNGVTDADLLAGTGGFSGALLATGFLQVDAGGALGWNGRSKIYSPGDGTINFRNNANLSDANINVGAITFSGHLIPAAIGTRDLSSAGAMMRDILQRGDYFNYNTGFLGTSNQERGFMRWNSNVYEIGTEKNGTGVGRIVRFVASSSGTAFEFVENGTNRLYVGGGGVSCNVLQSYSLRDDTTLPYQFYGAGDSGMGLVSITAGNRAVRFRTDGADALTLGGSGVSRRASFAGQVNIAIAGTPSNHAISFNNSTNGIWADGSSNTVIGDNGATRLTIGTNGATFAGSVLLNGSSASVTIGDNATGTNSSLWLMGNSAGRSFSLATQGTTGVISVLGNASLTIGFDRSLTLSSAGTLRFSNATDPSGTPDIALVRSTANVLDARCSGGFRVRNYTNTGDANLQAGDSYLANTTTGIMTANQAKLWNSTLISPSDGLLHIRGDGGVQIRNAANTGGANFQAYTGVFDIVAPPTGIPLTVGTSDTQSLLLRTNNATRVTIDGATGNAFFNSVLPSTNATYNLGSATFRWQRVHANEGFHAGNGSATNPVFTFISATDTGPWLVSATVGSRAVAISTDGAEAVRFGGSGTGRATTFAGNITPQKGITIRSGLADPTTSDLDTGTSSIWKNTTNGEIRMWVNDGGTMKNQ